MPPTSVRSGSAEFSAHASKHRGSSREDSSTLTAPAPVSISAAAPFTRNRTGAPNAAKPAASAEQRLTCPPPIEGPPWVTTMTSALMLIYSTPLLDRRLYREPDIAPSSTRARRANRRAASGTQSACCPSGRCRSCRDDRDLCKESTPLCCPCAIIISGQEAVG